MPEPNDKRVARKARNRALGLCFVSAKHGPAAAYGFCEACATAHRAKRKRHYAQARGQGMCVNAPSHGAATNGRLCDGCFAKRRAENKTRRRKPMCVFGTAHGFAVDGTYCATCVARRNAAAQRIAKRNETPAATPTPKAPRRKETLRERVERGGNIDSSRLWELFWRQQ